MNELSNQKKEPNWAPLVVVATLAVATWLIYLSVVPSLFENWTERGQFGDMFGALNALFSAIAFAALVYTMILQKAELQLQRLELEETRNEIKGQKEQLEAQSRTFIIQAFESTFFHLIDLHHKIVDGTVRSTPIGEISGRECYARVFRDFASLVASEFQRLPGFTELELANKPIRDRLEFAIQELKVTYNVATNQVWEEIYSKNVTDLAHYFRNLYHIVKFVDTYEGISEARKAMYSSILRAQLSAEELALLLQNGLSHRGEKFKPLIEKYALLKNLDDGVLLAPSARLSYETGAFIARSLS